MSETTEIIYPVSHSIRGDNAHYHFCHIRGAQQNYAVCLNILKAMDENRLGEGQFVDCQRACTRDDCDAKKKRAEEAAAGKALYYKPRVNVNPANTRSHEEAQAAALSVSSGKYDLNNPSYARGWAQVGSTKKSNQEPARKINHKPAFKSPPEKPKTGYVTESGADLVNVLMQEQPAKKPEPSAPSVSIKPEPGESPLAFAKRRAQAMKEAQ